MLAQVIVLTLAVDSRSLLLNIPIISCAIAHIESFVKCFQSFKELWYKYK